MAADNDVSVAEFLGRFPEFCDAPKPLVSSVLEEAKTRTDCDVWGTKWQFGVLYLAAHLLAINPSSKNMRQCCDAEGKSTYLKERYRLGCTVTSGFRVTGRDC